MLQCPVEAFHTVQFTDRQFGDGENKHGHLSCRPPALSSGAHIEQVRPTR